MKSNTFNYWLGMTGAVVLAASVHYGAWWGIVLACVMIAVSVAHHTYVEAYNGGKFYEYHRNVQRALDWIEAREQTDEHIDREIRRIDKQKNIRHGSNPSATYEAWRAESGRYE